MWAAAGHYLRLGLAMQNAEYADPSWLAAAVTASYPEADLYAVESYAPPDASIIIRLRAQTAVNAGDVLSATTEGLEVGAAAPSATVTSVEEVALTGSAADQAAAAVSASGYAPEIKIALAAALVAVVVYLSHRIPQEAT